MIPAEHKKILLALVEDHLSPSPDDEFDDFIEGKGQGLVALLQYEVRSLALSRELTSSQRPYRSRQDADSRGTVRISQETTLLGESYPLFIHRL